MTEDAAGPAGAAPAARRTGAAAALGGNRPVPRSRRRIGLVLLALGVLLFLAVGWVGWRTYQAYRHLQAAAGQVTVLQEQVRKLESIDLAAASSTVGRLRADADDAVSDTSDPLYRLAGHLPLIGRDLRAISTVAQTVDGLAATTAPSLVDVARAVRPSVLAPKNGVIDISPIAGAATKLNGADAAVQAARVRIGGIDRQSLVGPLGRAVTNLQGKLDQLATTTDNAARIGRLAPVMLGAGGQRRYLVVFENLAEPRATGGLFGSFALLDVTAGRLHLAGVGSVARDIGRIDGTFAPALAVPATLPRALYGDLPGAYSTDTNLTPDYPTAAALLAQMYRIRSGVAVDGVLALDPVALGDLLEGTAPIPIGNGLSMTSTNITRILLSTAYALYPQVTDVPARDAFLAGATAKAFGAVTQAPGNAAHLLGGLTRAAGEHRLLLWSSHRAEQQDLLGTAVAGLLPAVDGAAPTIGLFRNDGTGGKLGYYAGGSATVTAGACDTRGHRVLAVVAPLTYSAPASGLPPYVLRTNFLLFAPIGASITSVAVDGSPAPVVAATENGRRVAMVTVELHPGGSAQLTAAVDMATPRSVAELFQPMVVLTPGVTSWKATAAPFAGC